MLILTRKEGESITISDDIKVTVLGVFGRQVRLGVDAPKKVIVHREEIYLKEKQKNELPERDQVGDLGEGFINAVIKMLPRRKRRPPQSRG